MTQDYITVAPAYGRQYKNALAAKKDWFAGLDFRCMSLNGTYQGGMYCSTRDFSPEVKVEIRYNNMRDLTIIENNQK